jgi:hypothetical protein
VGRACKTDELEQILYQKFKNCIKRQIFGHKKLSLYTYPNLFRVLSIFSDGKLGFD